jgi:hypothetical protein
MPCYLLCRIRQMIFSYADLRNTLILLIIIRLHNRPRHSPGLCRPLHAHSIVPHAVVLSVRTYRALATRYDADCDMHKH